MEDQLNLLRMNYKDLILYMAGLPDFPRNFTRDSIISAILLQDPNMLRDQLIFCAKNQGIKKDPYTGEEPGKIFHEYPGVEIRGLSTLYNACDTTALFLIGHEIYQKLTNDKLLFQMQETNILMALEYIKSHIKEGLFEESPSYCGGKEFSLKVTYWKDSELMNRENGQPIYPIVYTLAHVQNMRAIKSAIFLTKDLKLNDLYNEMLNSFKNKLFNGDKFYLAIDKKGPISGVSSDILHTLFYLDKPSLNNIQVNIIKKHAKELETTAGFRTLSKSDTFFSNDSYHSKTVWPFEQALIYIGAKKFDMKEIQNNSIKILNFLEGNDSETFLIEDRIKKSGCDPQLWTIAAKSYFKNQKGIFP